MYKDPRKDMSRDDTWDQSKSIIKGYRDTLCSSEHITEGRGSQKRETKKTRMHTYMTEKGIVTSPAKNGDERAERAEREKKGSPQTEDPDASVYADAVAGQHTATWTCAKANAKRQFVRLAGPT